MNKEKMKREIDIHIQNFINLSKDETFIENFVKITELCINGIHNRNTIFFAGNGGSSADAQHAATELVVRFKKNRKAISSVALGTNTAVATAISNDFGYDYIFSREFESLAKEKDIVIGISTSGNSQSIINLLKKAKEYSAVTIGLTGKNGGEMKKYCDYIICCPSEIVEQIQEMHGFLIHLLCKSIEESIL